MISDANVLKGDCTGCEVGTKAAKRIAKNEKATTIFHADRERRFPEEKEEERGEKEGKKMVVRRKDGGRPCSLGSEQGKLKLTKKEA